jgi:hypothetical protein
MPLEDPGYSKNGRGRRTQCVAVDDHNWLNASVSSRGSYVNRTVHFTYGRFDSVSDSTTLSGDRIAIRSEPFDM